MANNKPVTHVWETKAATGENDTNAGETTAWLLVKP